MKMFKNRFVLFALALLLPIAADAALKYSAAVRIARLASVESTISTSAVLKIRSGTAPSGGCADADAGTALAVMTLPSDWMAGASGTTTVTKAKSGTWEDTSADAGGTAEHFRIYASDGTTCHVQGSVTGSGGGGDMIVNNTSILITQPVVVTSFTITSAN